MSDEDRFWKDKALYSYIPLESFGDWIRGDGYACHIEIGLFGWARVDRMDMDWFSITADVQKLDKVPDEWFYKDWLIFYYAMRDFGFYINEIPWEKMRGDSIYNFGALSIDLFHNKRHIVL